MLQIKVMIGFLPFLMVLSSIKIEAQISSPAMTQVEIMKVPGVTTDAQIVSLTDRKSVV